MVSVICLANENKPVAGAPSILTIKIAGVFIQNGCHGVQSFHKMAAIMGLASCKIYISQTKLVRMNKQNLPKKPRTRQS